MTNAALPATRLDHGFMGALAPPDGMTTGFARADL